MSTVDYYEWIKCGKEIELVSDGHYECQHCKKENQMQNLYSMTEEEIAELYKVLIEEAEESNDEISR